MWQQRFYYIYLSNSQYFFTQQAEKQQKLGLLIMLNSWFPDLAAGGSDDWAKGVAGIRYSYTVELADSRPSAETGKGPRK